MLKIGMIVHPRGLIAPQLYRVADVNGKHADLRPMSLGGVPMQSPASDLRRYRVRTTDEVSWNENLVEVLRIVNALDEDLYEYEINAGGKSQTVFESELTVHEGSLASDPAVQLAHLDLAPWKLVSARTQLLEAFFKATARSLGIVGYNGARMLPIPHQINAARYALQFGRVRFLLADEVGLGKTVEAGLIVSTLRKYFPDWQAAIFVPESLTAQWAFEMYGKFGKTVMALSQEDFDEDQSGIILAHAAAEQFAKNNTPEILVVDEAHRIIHDDAAVTALVAMSMKAHAVLLLTATPVSDDAGNLLRLLQILDPDQFVNLNSADRLRELQSKQGKIEKVLQAIRQRTPNAKKIMAAWKDTGLNDPEIEDRLRDADEDSLGRHELHRMAALITDRYYPGARILRYRRKFLAQDNSLPLRIVDPLEYSPTSEEKALLKAQRAWLDLLAAADLAEMPHAQQVAAALIQAAHSSPLAVADWLAMRRGDLESHDGVTADPILLARRAMENLDPLKGEDGVLEAIEKANTKWQRSVRAIEATGRQLATSPRYTTFLKFLKEIYEDDPDSHVLVFTSFESNVRPLFLLLRKALTDIAEVYEMCGRQTRVEREKNAFEFQEFGSGCLLVSDELGGEGRNFQFSSHVVHYDLPLAPWTVEQRIGRCDRVGRNQELDVDSVVISAKGELDQAIFDFLSEGVGVFNDSIAPIEGELDRVMHRVMADCIGRGAEGVLDNMESVQALLESARERENADLLVRSAVGVEEARRIAVELNDEAELLELRHAVVNYARLFESMVDEQAEKRLAITVGEFHSLHAMQGVAGEMIGYFDRREAVRHERLNFFSPGHPFVRSLALAAMSESPDKTAIVRRKGIAEPALCCVCRVFIPPEFFAFVRELQPDLRPPLLSKSAALFGTRMLRVVVSLEGVVIPREPANERYYEPRREDDQSLHDAEDLEELLPEGWSDTCLAGAEAALDRAAEFGEIVYDEGREDFEDLVTEVIMRADPDEPDPERLIERIMEQIPGLAVELDSIALLLP